MWISVFAVIFIGHMSSAFSSCPTECSCPREAPRCAVGMSLVLDGCGCCKVCAKQLNEDCSETQPCDHAKGLECNFGASYGASSSGICRAKLEGRPCEYNSRIYQNGESFRPNCKHQCTCMDGAVGCVPLCPQELTLPSLGCAKPRLAKVPGQCCEDWVCDEDGSKTLKKPNKDGAGGKERSEEELTNRNELIFSLRGGLQSLAAFRKKPETRMVLEDGLRCVTQTTDWSQCSRTCGPGVSTRVTNNNGECKLVKESRLCEIRPCSQFPYSSLKKGKRCSRMETAREAVKLTHAGCSSLKSFRPKFCGSCLDGRCCVPERSRTVPVRFRCDDGDTFTKDVMIIQSCRCGPECPRSGTPFPFYRLFNDIHKFRD